MAHFIYRSSRQIAHDLVKPVIAALNSITNTGEISTQTVIHVRMAKAIHSHFSTRGAMPAIPPEFDAWLNTIIDTQNREAGVVIYQTDMSVIMRWVLAMRKHLGTLKPQALESVLTDIHIKRELRVAGLMGAA